MNFFLKKCKLVFAVVCGVVVVNAVVVVGDGAIVLAAVVVNAVAVVV